MSRAYNFGAGPATLPLEVLEQAQAEFVDFRGTGMSIMEHSHRGKDYDAVHSEAITLITELAGLGDDHQVLFLQGGASLQFAMVPMNILGEGKVGNYTNTGAWAKKAIQEAKNLGQVHIAADTSKASPARMPRLDEIQLSDNAAYLHVTSNETIGGTQWKQFPDADVLVADMSSDMFCTPLDFKKFGLIYAGAQKNLGPSGVTLVIIRKDLLELVSDKVPTMLQYKTHAGENSLYNTPTTFSIYMLGLVMKWLKGQGGLKGMAARNEAKAKVLYDAIDGTGFYRGTADVDFRSTMNVTFRLPSEELEAKFIAEASKLNMKGLKGHRSVGGVRASIYNAFPPEGVDALVAFMKDFEARNG